MNARILTLNGVCLGLCGFAFVTSATAATLDYPQSVADTALTIYSSAEPGAVPVEYYRPLPGQGTADPAGVPGYALVIQDRKITLPAGSSQLNFTDVAALIDPTTVQFSSVSDPGSTRALTQSFQFDLVSTRKLLSRYIDKQVTAQVMNGDRAVDISGTLLSSGDGLVLRGADGQIHALTQYSNLRFGELPGGLITRPTLAWDISARKAGAQTARVSYQTGGITWWADYNLTFAPGADANSGFLDISAWVSIVNLSGATYDDARLKLIAGDVQRAVPPPNPRAMKIADSMVASPAAAQGFSEKSFFEYHLYTLGRRVNLPDNSTQQLELFDGAKRVPARKIFVYVGQDAFFYGGSPYTDRNLGTASNKKVDAYLEFKNEEKVGLGIALPKGRIRVSQLDPADRSLQFIGEDVIDHTPKNERVLVKLGSAFDVVGERKQVDFAVDSKAKWLEEEFEVKLRNHKAEAVEVLVKETLFRWSNWTVKSASASYEKQDARTVLFPVKVAADGAQTLRYRVRYTW